MSATAVILAEYDREMAGTRKLLALIPNDRLDWAPHAKSMSLSKLGQHLVTMPKIAPTRCVAS